MKTNRVNLSLPHDVKEKAQVLADRFNSGKISHLFSDFVTQEYERIIARDRLTALLEDGVNSPVSAIDAHEFFTSLRERIRSKAK